MRITYFVTPHGFGHAARAAAVMVALQEIDPAIQFDIFTQVPRWFFQDSLVRNEHYYDVRTDVGVVQATSLQGIHLSRDITSPQSLTVRP